MLTLTRRGFMVTAAATAVVATTRPSFAAPLKVAGIHTVPVENPWNSRLHAAMNAAAAAGTITYEYSENVANTDYPRVMREYAEAGAVLIVGESYGVEREAREAAKDYPTTTFFMGSSGPPDGSNFSVFGTWSHEAAYLTGMLAGRLTKTNVLGSVGGYPIPEVNLVINGFRHGASSVNPEVQFKIGFIGTWYDPPKAKEAALAQIDAGADILYGERIGTADAAKDRGVHSMGSLSDFASQYPETVIASAVWNFEPILAACVGDVAGGTAVAKDYSEFSFMKHGGNSCNVNTALVSQELIDLVEAKRQEIAAGTFEVPLDKSEPT